jgi:hypothetical protein
MSVVERECVDQWAGSAQLPPAESRSRALYVLWLPMTSSSLLFPGGKNYILRSHGSLDTQGPAVVPVRLLSSLHNGDPLLLDL